MTEHALTVGPGRQITMHFALCTESGQEIDSTFGRRPATFEVGDGNLLPGFEAAMFGLGPGTTTSLRIAPESGFGQRKQANIRRISRHLFAPDLVLEAGLVLAFADATAGAELPGVVVEHDDETVVVDFNHPLAGMVLRFDVRILNIKPAGAQ